MQFAFIPVSMALLSDPRYVNLSSDAKLLYALLLNRMNLSRKNGWFDEEKRVFWARGNWQPLCEHHHNVKTMTEDRYVEYKF